MADTTYDVRQAQFEDTEDIDRTEVRSYWQLARQRFVRHRLAVGAGAAKAATDSPSQCFCAAP